MQNHGEQPNSYWITGIDPTGGDLGPDFDIETGRYFYEIEEEKQRQETIVYKTTEECLDEIIEKLDRIIKAQQQK